MVYGNDRRLHQLLLARHGDIWTRRSERCAPPSFLPSRCSRTCSRGPSHLHIQFALRAMQKSPLTSCEWHTKRRLSPKPSSTIRLQRATEMTILWHLHQLAGQPHLLLMEPLHQGICPYHVRMWAHVGVFSTHFPCLFQERESIFHGFSTFVIQWLIFQGQHSNEPPTAAGRINWYD